LVRRLLLVSRCGWRQGQASPRHRRDKPAFAKAPMAQAMAGKVFGLTGS